MISWIDPHLKTKRVWIGSPTLHALWVVVVQDINKSAPCCKPVGRSRDGFVSLEGGGGLWYPGGGISGLSPTAPVTASGVSRALWPIRELSIDPRDVCRGAEWGALSGGPAGWPEKSPAAAGRAERCRHLPEARGTERWRRLGFPCHFNC